MTEFDIVLHGGRVIDPASGLDACRDVGITDSRIEAVSIEALTGRKFLDVTGKVVSPGFIDLHSHGQKIPEQRLQALDGVTTALELENGAWPVETAYRRAALEGRPIHYGFSTSWALARMSVVAGLDLSGRVDPFLHHIADPRWQQPAGPEEVRQILDRLAVDLAAGALGIGVLLGYAQEVGVDEYLAVARLAAEAGAPTYTHARDLVESRPQVKIDGATEIVQVAAASGAHMHYCHINSTSSKYIDRVLTLLERTRAEGGTVSAEVYPYGVAMTGIGAAGLSPERLAQQGLSPTSVFYAPTGERVADATHLRQLRQRDPGGLAFIEFLAESNPDEFRLLELALSSPMTAVASDAMPIHWRNEVPDPYDWPLPSGGITHPRGAGCFSRTLRLARQRGIMSLPDALSKCTILPARVLEGAAPSMRRKGRLQEGCDADIVVFDPELVTDCASFRDTLRPSRGIEHVVVYGTFVVADGELVRDALPGRPVRRESRPWYV